jgi:hypothetical protein
VPATIQSIQFNPIRKGWIEMEELKELKVIYTII